MAHAFPEAPSVVHALGPKHGHNPRLTPLVRAIKTGHLLDFASSARKAEARKGGRQQSTDHQHRQATAHSAFGFGAGAWRSRESMPRNRNAVCFKWRGSLCGVRIRVVSGGLWQLVASLFDLCLEGVANLKPAGKKASCVLQIPQTDS